VERRYPSPHNLQVTLPKNMCEHRLAPTYMLNWANQSLRPKSENTYRHALATRTPTDMHSQLITCPVALTSADRSCIPEDMRKHACPDALNSMRRGCAHALFTSAAVFRTSIIEPPLAKGADIAQSWPAQPKRSITFRAWRRVNPKSCIKSSKVISVNMRPSTAFERKLSCTWLKPKRAT